MKDNYANDSSRLKYITDSEIKKIEDGFRLLKLSNYSQPQYQNQSAYDIRPVSILEYGKIEFSTSGSSLIKK